MITREEAKEYLPIMQAFAEGKTIQYLDDYGFWNDIKTCVSFDHNTSCYRIKPEIKYRPFETREECWNEMLKHQPFGWVKSPRGELFCIDKVFEEGIVYKHSSCHFNEYLEGQYSFVDGTPFGIKEE